MLVVVTGMFALQVHGAREQHRLGESARHSEQVLLHAACRAGAPFELVVLDSNMPGMDGLDLARAIRRAPSPRGARLVMLTSSGDHRAATREAGWPQRSAQLGSAQLGSDLAIQHTARSHQTRARFRAVHTRRSGHPGSELAAMSDARLQDLTPFVNQLHPVSAEG